MHIDHAIFYYLNRKADLLFVTFFFFSFFFNGIYILDKTIQLFQSTVINVCPVLVPSEFLLSTHLPTSEGWTAELTVGLWQNGSDGGIRTHASKPRMIRNTAP